MSRLIEYLPLAPPHPREAFTSIAPVRPKFYPLMDTFDYSSQVASNLYWKPARWPVERSRA
jgi:hypothetical protein